jgi:hypothetical protein
MVMPRPPGTTLVDKCRLMGGTTGTDFQLEGIVNMSYHVALPAWVDVLTGERGVGSGYYVLYFRQP